MTWNWFPFYIIEKLNTVFKVETLLVWEYLPGITTGWAVAFGNWAHLEKQHSQPPCPSPPTFAHSSMGKFQTWSKTQIRRGLLPPLILTNWVHFTTFVSFCLVIWFLLLLMGWISSKSYALAEFLQEKEIWSAIHRHYCSIPKSSIFPNKNTVQLKNLPFLKKN